MYREVVKSHLLGLHLFFKALLAIGLFGLGASAQAFPNMGLFLELGDSPDITSTAITVTYDSTNPGAGTGTLQANGFASNLRLNGANHTIEGPGTFHLDALIATANGDASSGSLTIMGEITGLGSGTLLTGMLAGFGSGPAGTDRLDFLFDNLSGSLATYFTAGSAGVILSNAGFTTGNFQSPFGTVAGAVADTAIQVPEPGTLGLILTGGLLFYARKRAC